MPTTKTAEKEMRVAEKRHERNKSIRSRTKTEITKAENLIAGGKLDEAKTAVTQAISAIDKETEKGVAHRNKAARRKSRLMKKLNNAAAPKTEKKST